jgi:ABC-type sugar transport system substrate-binding protein
MQLLRCEAIKDLAKEIPDRLEVIDERYGNWDTQISMGIVEDWLQRFSDLNFISNGQDICKLCASNG